jgi:hypothetical protein
MQQAVLRSPLPCPPASNMHGNYIATALIPLLSATHGHHTVARHQTATQVSSRCSALCSAPHLQAEVARPVCVLVPSHGLCTLLQPYLQAGTTTASRWQVLSSSMLADDVPRTCDNAVHSAGAGLMQLELNGANRDAPVCHSMRLAVTAAASSCSACTAIGHSVCAAAAFWLQPLP